MHSFQDKLKISLSKKNLNKLSIWAYCIQMIYTYFDDKFQVEWYMKNWKLFVRINPNFAKTRIYIEKQKIIEKINNWLDNFWYKQKIDDIICK